MKSLSLAAAALALMSTTAFAGGMAEPVAEPAMAPAVVAEDTGSSAQGLVVPLLLLVIIAAVASN